MRSTLSKEAPLNIPLGLREFPVLGLNVSLKGILRTEEEIGRELKNANGRLVLLAGICFGSTVGMCARPELAAVAIASYPFLVSAYRRVEELQDRLKSPFGNSVESSEPKI
jgi:hypothetical protein